MRKPGQPHAPGPDDTDLVQRAVEAFIDARQKSPDLEPTTFAAGFPEPLRIVGDIPIVMEIPVQVPLQPTPVGTYLEKMAGQLDSLLGW